MISNISTHLNLINLILINDNSKNNNNNKTLLECLYILYAPKIMYISSKSINLLFLFR